MSQEALTFDILARDQASRVFAKVADKVEDLSDELDELGRKKVEPKVDVDTKRAEEKIERFAKNLRKKIDTAVKNLPDVEITADSSDADREIAQVKKDLKELRDKEIGVDIDAGAAEARLRELTARLARLNSESVDIKVKADTLAAVKALSSVKLDAIKLDVDTKGAEKQVGAFATDLRRRLDAAVKTLPELEITADSSDADRDIARLRVELQALQSAEIGVDIDAAAAETRIREIKGELDRLAASSPDIRVQTDAAAAIAALKVVDAEVDGLDGRTARVKVDIDKSLADSVIQFAALGRAMSSLALPAAIVAAAPQIAALGAAAVTASGALLLVPAAGGAAAAAIGTLVVGFNNFGDAVSADGEKAAEALGKLTPPAREAAQALRDLGPIWDTLADRVQSELFEGFADEIDRLGTTYLPVLSDAMAQVAEGFNFGATRAAAFLEQASTVDSVRTMFDDLAGTVENLTAQTMAPLTSVFVDLGSVGASVLKDLSAGAGDAAQRFADFISEARATGELEDWIRGGVDALGQLGSIAGNVGGVLGGIFKASRDSGADFLATLDQVTAKMSELVNSAQGQSALVSLFRDISAGVQAALPGIEALVQAVGDVVRALADAGVLQSAGAAFSAIAQQVAPLISSLSGLAPLISGLLDVVAALAPVLTSAAIAFGAFWAAAKVVDGVQAIAGRVRAFGDAIGQMGRQASGGGALGAISTLGRSLGAGGVLGLGLAAAGIALQIWSDRNAEAARAAQANKAKVDELAGSFDKVTGSATAATREIKAQELTQVKLADGTTSLATALDQLGISSQTWVDATTGSIPAQQQLAEQLNRVTQRAIEQSPAWRENAAQVQSWGVSLQDVVAAANGNVEAQNRLRDAARYSAAGITENERANSELVDTLIRTGGASGEVASRLGEAIGRYAEAKTQADQVREATAGFTDGLKALGNEGLRVFAALAAGTPATTEMAAGLQQVGASATTMALDVGRSTAAVSGVEQGAIQARDKMAGLRQQFIDSATAAGMAAPQAAELANQLGLIPSAVETQIRTNATGVAAELVTLNAQIAAVPAGKDVKVQALTDEAKAKLTDMGFQVEQLKDGTFRIFANTDEARARLAETVAAGNSATATMLFKADGSPAQGTIQTTVGVGNGSSATMTYLANSDPATGKISTTAAIGNRTIATMTLDANNNPATGKISYSVRYADGSTGTITVNANDAAARNAIAALQRPTSSTHTVNVRYNDRPFRPGAGLTTRAMGGYATPAAYAQGGFRPMSPARAEVVPARQPRLIGDRMRGDEAFIPVNRSRRSMSILRRTAQEMGQAIVPLNAIGMANGGMLSAARAILGRMNARGQMFEDWTWRGAPAYVGQYNDALFNEMKRAGYSYANGKRFLEDYIRRASAAPAQNKQVISPPAQVRQVSRTSTTAAAASTGATVAATSQAASIVAAIGAQTSALTAAITAQTAALNAHARGDLILNQHIAAGGTPRDTAAEVARLCRTQGSLGLFGAPR